jgi:AraC family transcriptional regulator of adaptative response / DNA-3-methyladenine glycosylase II
MNMLQAHDDFDLCYRALCSRDSRFDGRFFTAVTSTGIYCRPICPAPTPYAQNVRFYPCAAAAEAAGFRACRRCHPEASPGSPDWNVRADLVARALRMISDGIVDSEGISGLAGRLAVSERHLHRELVAEIGVGPLALARSRRAQTARLLIDQTNLSLTTIAFAAGFASIRQFNDTMQEVFACAPSELRRHAQPASNGEGKLSLRLQYRPPFDAEALLTYLEKRAIPGIEEVISGRYRRTVAFAQSRGIVEIEPAVAGNAIRLHVQLNDLSALNLLVQRCRRFFDLDADPAAIASILRTDPLLALLIDTRPGLRVPGAINGFEFAVRAIIGQQISVQGARTLVGRLAKSLGEPLPVSDGTLTHTFPTPEVMTEADMSGLGLTQRRIIALQALAQSVARQELILDASADREETATRLQALPGVGPWTAAYIAMRALNDPDAFPTSDLGLRRAFEQHGLAADVKSIERHAEAWRPWRAYATQHLWTSLAERK